MNEPKSRPIQDEGEVVSRKFTKKPVTIEAVIWDGRSFEAMQAFTDNGVYWKEISSKHYLCVKTLEGEHVASVGDYIIKGVKGEFYPCKPDIFAMTYVSTPAAQPESQPALDAKGFVTDIFSEAYLHDTKRGGFDVVDCIDRDRAMSVGYGKTEEAAWADAATRQGWNAAIASKSSQVAGGVGGEDSQ